MPKTEQWNHILRQALTQPETARVLLAAARAARPGNVCRLGLLSREQRSWLRSHFLPVEWWPSLSESEKAIFEAVASPGTAASGVSPPASSEVPDKITPEPKPCSSSSPIQPRALFLEETERSRKPRATTWSQFGNRAKANRASAVAQAFLECCESPEDAAELLSLAARKVEKAACH